MYNYTQQYIQSKDGIFYFVRRIPVDVLPYYSFNRISISLKTKSAFAAVRASKSINRFLYQAMCGLGKGCVSQRL